MYVTEFELMGFFLVKMNYTVMCVLWIFFSEE